ncbi:MAG: hypothetical protein KDI62_27890 [Anaerolineae bacterium]|nr:hypothetical protein [Anaerolineae bacterium]MCB9105849.1 hypothetical protein [Anaerolineales bacterium]
MTGNVHVINEWLVYVYLDDWLTFQQVPGKSEKLDSEREIPFYQKRFKADQVEIAFMWFDPTPKEGK